MIDSSLSHFEEDVFQLAASLDTRWKLDWCTPEESAKLKQIIIEKVTEQKKLFFVGFTLDLSQTLEASPSPKRPRLFEFMQVSPNLSHSTELGINSNVTSVEKYVSSPCLSRDANLLDYWKRNQCHFLELSRLACLYLPIPASSAERLFSIAGKVFCLERCKLGDNLFEKLMFIRSNSKDI